MKWIDSRVAQPTSNHFDTYMVTYLIDGLPPSVGLADWVPRDGYKAGDWQNVRCTNGNKLGGEVLYWMPHPKIGEIGNG